ncbi:MAG TPA: thiamine phosphate synthase [Bryobacteraceae bacterium]|nr:thiamine phosphate synthase [Bryobacteraceae bacterium]
MQLPRFYPILDTALLEQRGFALLEAAGILLAEGVRLVQLRHKGHYSRDLFGMAETLALRCREQGATLIINDRADIAMLLNAGLHIGQEDLPPADARRLLGPGRVLGFSTHGEEQFVRALGEPVDYLAVGPIFATTSKSNPDPVVGVELLRTVRRLTDRPLVAIGGVTRRTARDVLAAGANAVAVIGDLYPEPLTRRSLEESIREWLAATT